MIYDISPIVDANTAVWPGDTPYSVHVSMRLGDGDPVNLSDVHLSCHTGAHADAPSHFEAGAPGIDEVLLRSYLGPCTLLDVRPTDDIIRPHDLSAGGLLPRVLFRTREHSERTVFSPTFSYLSPDLVDLLAGLGVMLVGLDSPSVDAFDSTDLPVHKALYRCGIANLESLQLDDVPVGEYELIALPLRLSGRDASPVRAVLRGPLSSDKRSGTGSETSRA